MNNSPLISVIIANLNRYSTLTHCIDSILSQTYHKKELIIIDGDSKDGSLEILKSYHDRITYWESKTDRGIYSAWNKALKHAQGEWFCFLGADDFFLNDNVLLNIVPHLINAKINDVRVVYGQVAVVDVHGKILTKKGKPWNKIKWQMLHGMPRNLPHPGLMHHYTLFEEHGYFDETFKIAGDYEFLLRELKNNNAFFVDNLITVGHQEGGVADSFKIATQIEVIKARRKNGLNSFSWLWVLIFIRTLSQALYNKIIH